LPKKNPELAKMAKTGLALILFFSVFSTYSQESGLILIDADNQQPFIVRMGEKTYPSSNIGHITISNLRDSTYLVIIGFPGTQYPEEQFNIKVSKKDQGFQLKLIDGKQWILYNWQTRENNLPLNSSGAAGISSLKKGIRMDDAFSKLMAAVVNDSLVLYNNFIEDSTQDTLKLNTVANSPPGEKLKDSINLIPAPDTARKMAGKKNVKPKTAKNLKAGSVVMLTTQNSGAAIQLVYISYSKKGIPDTVNIEIPFDSVGQLTNVAAPVPGAKTEPKENRPDTTGAMALAAQPERKLPNTNCKKAASDHEVDQLRVKMMNEYIEDHRIDVVKKFFKTRCMTVTQVKSLAELFQGDKGRYYFFETAYSSVFDPENYAQLLDTMLDKEYRDQFSIHFLGQKN
jgi:Domain of unknown function (DUF4476)